MKKTLIAVAGLLALAACQKPAPPPEPAPPQPKAEETAAAPEGDTQAQNAAQQSAVSQTLNAPGNYLKNVTGQVKTAKDAVALSNRQAEERMNQDPAALPGGN